MFKYQAVAEKMAMHVQSNLEYLNFEKVYLLIHRESTTKRYLPSSLDIQMIMKYIEPECYLGVKLIECFRPR